MSPLPRHGGRRIGNSADGKKNLASARPAPTPHNPAACTENKVARRVRRSYLPHRTLSFGFLGLSRRLLRSIPPLEVIASSPATQGGPDLRG